jgi:hypothetical protein
VTIAVAVMNGAVEVRRWSPRNATKQASALATARQRRREPDKARDAHDECVEQATAAALLALEVRTVLTSIPVDCSSTPWSSPTGR